MARKTIVLLRSVVSALQFPTKGEHTWKMPILNEKEREAVKEAVGEFDSHRTPMILAMCKFKCTEEYTVLKIYML